MANSIRREPARPGGQGNCCAGATPVAMRACPCARVVAVTLLAWLPLLLLSALEGHALGTRVAVPFLHDIDAHIRFLLALPLLMVAAVEADRRLAPLLQQFTERSFARRPCLSSCRPGAGRCTWSGPSPDRCMSPRARLLEGL